MQCFVLWYTGIRIDNFCAIIQDYSIFSREKKSDYKGEKTDGIKRAGTVHGLHEAFKLGWEMSELWI